MYRSVVTASTRRPMVAAPTACASTRSASSRPSRRKPTPSCPRTRPIHTCAIRAVAEAGHLRADRRRRQDPTGAPTRPYTAHTASHCLCRTRPVGPSKAIRRKAMAPAQRGIRRRQATMGIRRIKCASFQAPLTVLDLTLTQQQRAMPHANRRASSGAFEYPDPTQVSPASGGPVPSYGMGHPYPPPPPQQQPYYPPQQHPGPPPPQSARRGSPTQNYPPYDNRSSVSPHGSTASSAGGNQMHHPPFPGGLHPPQVLPPTYEAGRTPPPKDGGSAGGTNGARPGMSVRDMLGPDNAGNGPSRSTTDEGMLKALNRGRV